MPELKASDIVAKLQKNEIVKDIQTGNEGKELHEIAKETNTTEVDEAINKEKISEVVTKKINEINKVENIRQELGVTDLNKEETDKIAQEKKELLETLTGMNPLVVEEDHSQLDLEKNVLGDPDSSLEKREAITFNMKEVYTSVSYVLDAFDQRHKGVGGFDIISQSSFNNFAELHQFMREKVLGGHPDDETNKVDFSMRSEINDEMIERFQNAINSLQIESPGGWQSPYNSGEEQVKSLNQITQALGNFEAQLSPFAQVITKSDAYRETGKGFENSIVKLKGLTEFMGDKTQSYAAHLR